MICPLLPRICRMPEQINNNDISLAHKLHHKWVIYTRMYFMRRSCQPNINDIVVRGTCLAANLRLRHISRNQCKKWEKQNRDVINYILYLTLRLDHWQVYKRFSSFFKCARFSLRSTAYCHFGVHDSIWCTIWALSFLLFSQIASHARPVNRHVLESK